MSTQPQIRYFLGANSPHGFYSLYNQMIPSSLAKAVYLLKGGAGGEKAWLLRHVAQQLETAGLTVEYIYCAGNITALDAILIPEKQAAVIDSTAPHLVEPELPGVVEHFVNLECHYRACDLLPLREQSLELIQEYKSSCGRACRCLTAVAEIEEDQRALLVTPALEERLAKRAKGILTRELKGRPKAAVPGAVKQRFLSGVTHMGTVCWFDTVEAQCQRVYELADSYGLAHVMLTHLITAFLAAGYDAVACLSPMAPDRLEHLLVPELSLAFVTSSPSAPYEKQPARRIRLDAMADSELLRRNKPRLRFSKKVAAAILEEAVGSLSQARAAREQLEKLLRPHIDMASVEVAGDAVAAALLAL